MKQVFVGTISLEQLLRRGIGFDKMFSDLARSVTEVPSYPPYNIIKRSDTLYAIEVAVAGFAENELNAEIVNGELVVTGKIEDDGVEVEYLHRGIAGRNFTRTFALADSVEVKDAGVSNGILTINLEHIIPEAEVPKRIAITFQK